MNAYADDTLYEYSPLHGLECWLRRFIRAYQYTTAAAILTLLTIGYLAWRGNQTAADYFRYLPYLRHTDTLYQILTVFTAIFFIISGLMTFTWLFCANENLHALSPKHARIRYTPGRTILWWFIPILNLCYPYSIMAELWRGSLALAHDPEYDNENLIFRWWMTFLAIGCSSMIAGHTANAVITGIFFLLTMHTVALISAQTLNILIHRINQAQAAVYQQQQNITR